ncbi:MAG TPA: YfiR family protein [Candidatus Wallbacteria bacterium]|nr:YfiR family protein [Candidatus Wallbacteria bacterium]
MKIMKTAFLTVLSFFIMAACIRQCLAQPTGGSLESDVKAAYILNIMKFVDWRDGAEAGGKLKIGVLGSDSVGEVLEKLKNNKIGERILVVEKVEESGIASCGCHLLYIGKSEKDRLDDILKKLKGSSILTVSDLPDFARKGGIAGFAIENDRVKIEININESKRAGLKIGAKLLEVARLIK